MVLGAPPNPLRVYVGQSLVEYGKAQPVRRGRLLLIPLRETVEKMGGTVVRSPLGRRVFVTLGRRRVELSMNGGKSRLNGIPRVLKDAPWISRGEVVVPLGFFAHALGATTVDDRRRRVAQIVPRGGIAGKPHARKGR